MSRVFLKVRSGLNLGSLTADPSDPNEGDFYYNTTTTTFRQYISGAWHNTVGDDLTQTLTNKSLVDNTTSIVGNADATKKINFTAAGTTATTTTVQSSQTINRTLTLPDVTDTLVALAATQSLSNKQIAYSVATDSTTTGANTTIGAFTTGLVRLTNTSLTSISGVPAGTSGQILIVENKTGNQISINNEEATATAANRIQTGAGGNVSMANNATFAFTYDTTSSRWQLTGGSGSGSGSGGYIAPTVQKFTSSSGTYTLPTSPRTPLYIRVRAVGAGGGGGGGGTTAVNGTGGNSTTFGTSLLVAGGGGGGAGGSIATGGIGGSSSLGSGPVGLAATGNSGGTGSNSGGSTVSYQTGGVGGGGAFGGAGYSGGPTESGGNAAANSGGGGGGGGTGTGVANEWAGGGGGAGGFVDAIITSPLSTYAWVVGGGGAGASNTYNGGNGGSGLIIVEEHYQ